MQTINYNKIETKSKLEIKIVKFLINAIKSAVEGPHRITTMLLSHSVLGYLQCLRRGSRRKLILTYSMDPPSSDQIDKT